VSGRRESADDTDAGERNAGLAMFSRERTAIYGTEGGVPAGGKAFWRMPMWEPRSDRR